MITKEELEAIKTRVAKEVETPIPANWESHIDVILDEDIPKLISTVEKLQEELKLERGYYPLYKAARDDALEEAARVCEDVANHATPVFGGPHSDLNKGEAHGATYCAEVIRKVLKGKN